MTLAIFSGDPLSKSSLLSPIYVYLPRVHLGEAINVAAFCLGLLVAAVYKGVCKGGHDCTNCLYGVGDAASVIVHVCTWFCKGSIYGSSHSRRCLFGVVGGGCVIGRVDRRPCLLVMSVWS